MTSVILAKTWNAEFIFQETSTNTSETAKTCFYVHVEQQSIKKVYLLLFYIQDCCSSYQAYCK